MDADSALIWSPSHFTWMDTNYPAGTPREGYPVEIQALWIRLLRQLAKISDGAEQKKWRDLADHALASFEKLFWLEEQGWFADVLLGGSRVIARDATASDALAQQLSFRREPRPRHRRTRETLRRGRAEISGRAGRVALARAAAGFAPLPVYANGGGLLNNPPNRIGRVTKATKTRAANPRITTARRGRGRSRFFAKRWRARGIFHRKRSRRRKLISAARNDC